MFESKSKGKRKKKQNQMFGIRYHALVSEEDATERATFAASASPLAPVTVTCTSNSELAGKHNEPYMPTHTALSSLCLLFLLILDLVIDLV